MHFGKKLFAAALVPATVRAFSTPATTRALLVGSKFLVTRPSFAVTQPTTTAFSGKSCETNNKPITSSTTRAMSSSSTEEVLCVHVFVSCKPGTEEAFKEASMKNARNSAKEEGIARFDVIQQIDDPTQFVLVEVYKNDEAPALHKETAHYLEWRETVADMMAEPRKALKYKNHFPGTFGGWDYTEGASLE